MAAATSRRKVRSFLSDHDAEADMASEVFVLDGSPADIFRVGRHDAGRLTRQTGGGQRGWVRVAEGAGAPSPAVRVLSGRGRSPRG